MTTSTLPPTLCPQCAMTLPGHGDPAADALRAVLRRLGPDNLRRLASAIDTDAGRSESLAWREAMPAFAVFLDAVRREQVEELRQLDLAMGSTD